ncbi:ABC transporter ATP-binding protein [Rubrobacter aplysinae]|uniref:ABC transporter ATP-binding protein n=1 Tax=Rubrobacter aplysinae TaxID=909625 RepID=UPI00064BBC7A|nr:ABC transporter ATP-binding protein [Rubrobacter aplysinae]
MLELRDVHAYYGSSYVLQGASLGVEGGEVVALLGRNGVGKTTTIRAVMGLLRSSGGSISFKGEAIEAEASHKRARRGLGLVPQGRGIFPNLSVREQLVLPPRRSEAEGWSLEEVYELFPRLRERDRHSGDQLSGGEQQMLAIARALRGSPDLLLLDEPSDGLSPMMVSHVGEILKSLKSRSLSILLVEQNLQLALSVADRIYVMNKGRVVHESSAAELAEDKEMQQQLLGV